MMEEPITYMNSKDSCIVCFKEPEKWQNGVGIELIKHHISYYPEIIAFVHYDCHARIHDINSPLTHLIQYADGDSRKFYEEKVDREKNDN